MAQTDYKSAPLAGINLYAVDTTQKYPLNMIVSGISSTLGYGEFIYLKGLAATVEGTSVTYDEVGVTALLTDDAKGPVAFAMAATVASTFGWYQILGKIAAQSTGTADNAFVGHEATDGVVGDARDAGDQIYGVISRSATDTPATGFCWLQAWMHPFVDDTYGA